MDRYFGKEVDRPSGREIDSRVMYVPTCQFQLGRQREKRADQYTDKSSTVRGGWVETRSPLTGRQMYYGWVNGWPARWLNRSENR